MVEIFLALQRADDRPSINRAIMLTRALGHRFTNDEARMLLTPFAAAVNRSLTETSPKQATGNLTGASPPSSIYPHRDFAEEDSSNAHRSLTETSPARAREKFEFVPKSNELTPPKKLIKSPPQEKRRPGYLQAVDGERRDPADATADERFLASLQPKQRGLRS